MSQTKPFSIRKRIFSLGTILLVCALVVLFGFLQRYAHRAAEQAFDRLLAASALTIAGSVQIEDDDITVELPVSALAMLSGYDRVFYEVRTATGQLITGYGDLAPDAPLAYAASPVFTYQNYNSEPVRLASVGRLVSASQHAGWVTVRVAETLDSRTALANEILRSSLLPLILMVLVALCLLWFGVQRAFAPLSVVEHELRRREPDDLQPLTMPVPQEVSKLVEALNAFMQRLSQLMGSLNALVADAAHQVRTPLASLRAQAEVALEERDPEQLQHRITRIHANAIHASQLIHQLLMDATITHRLSKARSPIRIREVLYETYRRIGPLDAQRLHLHIAAESRRARVVGDRIALREMLRNLIDNALRYAPEGDITISVTPAHDDAHVILSISDQGPGISNDEKEQVLKRFVRGSSGQAHVGSGLGLSIACSVAHAHGGSLQLQDGPEGGLSVIVTLPTTTLRVRPSSAHSVTTAALCSLALLLSLGSLPSPVYATPAEEIPTFFPSTPPASKTLTIAGPTDTPIITPLIHSFQAQYPEVQILYREIGSMELYEGVISGQLSDVDVLISSATDLQLRLANDGYAQYYVSPYRAQIPSWAMWRNEVYGFAFEPVVIAYNLKRYTADTVPRSRQDLLRTIENNQEALYKRLGTYDISRSSVGYLMAEQDELVSSNFWALTNAFGQIGAHLAPTSGEILDAIEHDELDLGYNMLGSYALARQAEGKLGVVFPQDYMLVLTRSALISRQAPNLELAQLWMDWLLSPAGQLAIAHDTSLGPIMDDMAEHWISASAPSSKPQGIVQPVALSPALLVGLDQRRHSRFVQNWIRLVTDTPLLPTTAQQTP